MNSVQAETDPALVLDALVRLAAILNERDPRLEAEVIELTPHEETLKIRLNTEEACSLSYSNGWWTGAVLRMYYAEWLDDTNEPISFPGPAVGLKRSTDEELGELADKIEVAVEDYDYETQPERPSASVREYFKLAEDCRNPAYKNEEFGGFWNQQEFFNEGRIFVVLREAGQPPQLYPPGFMHDAIAFGTEAYTELRKRLIYQPCPLRAVLIEERTDPVSIIEELLRRDIISHEDLFSLVGD